MAFQKGKSGNVSGRPKGTKNKLSGKTREIFQQIVEMNLPQIQSDLMELDPKDRLKIILEMTSFFLPKMQAQSIDIQTNAEVSIKAEMYRRIQEQYGLSSVIPEGEAANEKQPSAIDNNLFPSGFGSQETKFFGNPDEN